MPIVHDRDSSNFCNLNSWVLKICMMLQKPLKRHQINQVKGVVDVLNNPLGVVGGVEP